MGIACAAAVLGSLAVGCSSSQGAVRDVSDATPDDVIDAVASESSSPEDAGTSAETPTIDAATSADTTEPAADALSGDDTFAEPSADSSPSVDDVGATAVDAAASSPADATTTDAPVETSTSMICGSPPSSSYEILLSSTDASPTSTTLSSPACPRSTMTVVSDTPPPPVVPVTTSVGSFFLVATPNVAGHLTVQSAEMNASGGARLWLELVPTTIASSLGLDASHGLVFVVAKTIPSFGAPCGSLSGITYGVTGAGGAPMTDGVKVTYAHGGTPDPAMTSTDDSGAAFILVPTTPASSPSEPDWIHLVGTKSGCKVLNDAAGQTGNLPLVAGTTTTGYAALNPAP